MKPFGYDLVRVAHEEQVKSKTDDLVVSLHWCFWSKNMFLLPVKTLKLNDKFKLTLLGKENGALTEVLPVGLGWNDGEKSYNLKYHFPGDLNHFNVRIFPRNEALAVIMSDEEGNFAQKCTISMQEEPDLITIHAKINQLIDDALQAPNHSKNLGIILPTFIES